MHAAWGYMLLEVDGMLVQAQFSNTTGLSVGEISLSKICHAGVALGGYVKSNSLVFHRKDLCDARAKSKMRSLLKMRCTPH